MEKLQFKIEHFEGPLDLLLYLIRKHKLNIEDIEISELLRQYLDYINEMKAAYLEVSSEFLEMAARLLYIKTCALLPKQEEEIELKKQLTGDLLQKDAVQKAAKQLEKICFFGKIFVRKPEKTDVCLKYQRKHRPEELSIAYQRIAAFSLKRKQQPDTSSINKIVHRKVVSVPSRVIYIIKRLYQAGQVPYDDFFDSQERSEMVATFLAMLELIKSKRIFFNLENRAIEFRKQ